MTDSPKPKGVLHDDTQDKRSSTRVIALVTGLAGLLLVFIHGWVGWPSLLSAGNALLEFTKWLVLFIAGRSTVVQSAQAIGWRGHCPPATVPSPPGTTTVPPPPNPPDQQPAQPGGP